MAISYDMIEVGYHLPVLKMQAPQKEDSDRFMAAGDLYHPMHSDAAYAQSVGMKDVVIAGLQVLGHMGSYLTRHVPRYDVREFGGRFESICFPTDMLRIKGEVVEKLVVDGEPRARFALIMTNQDEEVVIRGDATVAFPR